MAKLTATYNFTFTDRVEISGLVVFEDVEISGRATFTFSPGSPARGPSYASGGEPAEDPEVEIDTLQVFGHAIGPEGISPKPEYRDLAPSDPRWQQIADWLVKERFSEMCEEAADADACAYDDAMEARAEARRDRMNDAAE